jgi:hypothetical protein
VAPGPKSGFDSIAAASSFVVTNRILPTRTGFIPAVSASRWMAVSSGTSSAWSDTGVSAILPARASTRFAVVSCQPFHGLGEGVWSSSRLTVCSICRSSQRQRPDRNTVADDEVQRHGSSSDRSACRSFIPLTFSVVLAAPLALGGGDRHMGAGVKFQRQPNARPSPRASAAWSRADRRRRS